MCDDRIHPNDQQMSQHKETEGDGRTAELGEGDAEEAATDVVVGGEINASGSDGEEDKIGERRGQADFPFHLGPNALPVKAQVEADEDQHGESSDAVEAMNPQGDVETHEV